MKAFWSAMLAILVVAVISAFALGQIDMSAGGMNSTNSVRLN